MSVNSSSTFDLMTYYCLISRLSIFIHTGFMSMKTLLLLPLCTFILFLGYRQWRQQRSFKAVSHSDLITYHLVVVEMCRVIGCILFLVSLEFELSVTAVVAMCLLNIVFFGEVFFHILTCVERYLAVIHPVTYLRFRNARWLRIRYIITGCVWLLSSALGGIYRSVKHNYASILMLCVVIISIIVTSFCSVSVLRILVRPGPGKGGAEKKGVDQLKQRAFFTITAISCALWLWFVGLLITGSVDQLPQFTDRDRCVVIACLNLFSLPSCVISPLLFLHKKGKLPHCRTKSS